MTFELWPGHRQVTSPWLQFAINMHIGPLITALGLSLFVCCMVCHGELARLKPHPRYLTGFYVIVSLGGAIGGLFVGLVAPNLFRAYYEFPIGLGFCALVLVLVYSRGIWSQSMPRRIAGTAVLVALLCGYGWCLTSVMKQMVAGYRVVARNFYGLLRVYDDGDPRLDESASRKLVHGIINHGQQMLREEYRRLPVTYFCPESGIGRGMRSRKERRAASAYWDWAAALWRPTARPATRSAFTRSIPWCSISHGANSPI